MACVPIRVQGRRAVLLAARPGGPTKRTNTSAHRNSPRAVAQTPIIGPVVGLDRCCMDS